MLRAALLCFLTFPAAAKDAEVTALARTVLTELQPLSIARNREYCGTIGLNAKGRLMVSEIAEGDRYTCHLPQDDRLVKDIASFHTHGAYTGDADGEVPSLQDLLSDMAAETDGYVSTPGGRFWFVDWHRGEVHQICGLNCLPADPEFRPKLWGPVDKSYDLKGLERRMGE
ncbi:MAG: DUF4329 domain-containing protein [Pseudomonadota bacterium]